MKVKFATGITFIFLEYSNLRPVVSTADNVNVYSPLFSSCISPPYSLSTKSVYSVYILLSPLSFEINQFTSYPLKSVATITGNLLSVYTTSGVSNINFGTGYTTILLLSPKVLPVSSVTSHSNV